MAVCRGILVVVAVCLLGGCAVDGGWVDPDAGLSPQADPAAVARTSEIEAAGPGTQAVMVAFYQSVCALQTRYRAELQAAEGGAGQLTAVQYRDAAVAMLSARATAAETARRSAAELPIPDLFPDEWRSAQAELTLLFDGLDLADRSRATEMAAVDPADADHLKTTARNLIAASAQQIENENPRIRVVADRLPAPKQVRRQAAELDECRTPS
ncbi:hypothetical protein ACFXK0_05725 [Nocardia sp. NPDC059177]|uniref:hypothetical protein n=1 Tax=Nocardia sp. NPDC059177 TaxID=3346759 RepID=UPI00368BDDED